LGLSHLARFIPEDYQRLPFRIEGDSACEPGIYDMKGGGLLATLRSRSVCATPGRSLGVTQL